MGNRLWRRQLTLVWLFGIAIFTFMVGLLGGPGGGNTNSVYDRVYAPLPEGVSSRGTLTSPFSWLDIASALIVWLAPLAAAWLAWQGRRALKDQNLDPGQRDRLRYGTTAAFVIAVSYLTPVGWTLVYGLTRWSMMTIWGEGPLADTLPVS